MKTEIRCPKCKKLQFKIERGNDTVIETKCWRARCHTLIRVYIRGNGEIVVEDITKHRPQQYPTEYK